MTHLVFGTDNNVLQEIAEPISDLKQGIAELRQSRTLKCILSTLLAVGNFLNGTEVASTVLSFRSLHFMC